MKRLNLSIFLVVLVCIVIAVLLFLHGSAGPETDSSMSILTLLGVHWIGVIKFLTAFIAGIMLVWQGLFGNILKTVRSSTILIGIGILAIAFGYGYDFYVRVFIMHGPLSSSLLLSSILYLVGGIFVAWALFAFPNKLQARLRETQRIWFIISIIFAFLVTIGLFIYMISSKEMNTMALIIQIAYPVLTLLVFTAALRCTMVFAEGKIGRPFLLIAVGSLAMFMFNYSAWALKPIIPDLGEFGVIHALFVFSFLITSIGAVDMTLREE
jgi:hypothetical protein